MSQAEGNIEGALCFDYPQVVCAKDTKPNPDPGSYNQPDIYQWSTALWGDPAYSQGSPALYEITPEPGQDLNMVVDLIMDQGEDDAFVLFHTSRLSGTFLKNLYDDTTCTITVDMVPKIDKNGAVFSQEQKDLILRDVDSSGPNMWGWLRNNNNEKTDYVCTFRTDWNANDFVADEIYSVIIRWKFYHVPQNGTPSSREPWGGFEDALHFMVRGQ